MTFFKLFLCSFSTLVISFFASAYHSVVAAPSTDRPIADKWALIIGIDRFADKRIPTLKYSAKDAKDFAKFLITDGSFAKDHVLTLLNEKATFENIEAALGDTWLPKRVMPDDLVVIFVSTHGSPKELDTGRGKENWLIAHNTNVDKLFSTGIELEELAATVKKRTGCARIVILLDACNSGAAQTEGGKGLIRTQNFNVASIIGEGQIVISSSASKQRSWESKRYKNGVFTRNLIKSLKENGANKSIDSVFASMKDKVSQEVLFDRKVAQTPVFKSKWQGKKLALLAPPTKPRTLSLPKPSMTVGSVSSPNTLAPAQVESSISKQVASLIKSKKYDQAMSLAKQGAKSGDLECIKLIGNMYIGGLGVPKNAVTALEWWHKAANQNYPKALHNIGATYYYGDGVPQDYNQAVSWLKKAVALNFAKSQFLLGTCYHYGYGVPKDQMKMLKLYGESAKQLEPTGLNAMGVCCRDGIGMPKNFAFAKKFFTQAAKKNDREAMFNLGLLYAHGRGVEKSPVKAFNWLQKSANFGYSYAQSAVGNCYVSGIGVPKDLNEAFKWFKLSAAQVNPEGLRNLGYAYRDGVGTTIDAKKAFLCFKKAADLNDALAIAALGDAYANGNGCPKNKDMAVKMYFKGADLGNCCCQTQVGYMYFFGKGAPKDFEKAVQWYQKAALQGCSMGQNNLGWAYLKGKGVKKDKATAIRYFKLAADQGNKIAKENLQIHGR